MTITLTPKTMFGQSLIQKANTFEWEVIEEQDEWYFVKPLNAKTLFRSMWVNGYKDKDFNIKEN